MTDEKKELFVDLSSIEPKEVEWFWEPLIPYGMVTIMEGDPGVGKSFLAMHLAALVSTGGKLPNGEKVDRGRVLYLSAEDDTAYTIRPRIDAMKGNAKRIRVQDDFLSLDDDGLRALMDEVRRKPPALMIIDPLFAYMPSGQDMYRPNVIRQLLSFLKEIAEMGDTAILIVRHLTKAKHDKAIYQGGGSMDVVGAARSAIRVAEHPDDPDTKVIVHIKHNIAPRGQSWAFELVTPEGAGQAHLEWIGPSDLTIEDLMGQGDASRKSALDQAIDLLREELKDGPKPTSYILQKAKEQEIAKRTIDRARSEIGVISKKETSGWVLSLPDD